MSGLFFRGKCAASERSGGWAAVYPSQTQGANFILDLPFRLLFGTQPRAL